MRTSTRLALIATFIHIVFSIYGGGRAYGEDFMLPLILIWALKLILGALIDHKSEAKE